MKITGGYLKGQVISVSDKNVRPTSSLVKQAMFSMIKSYLLTERKSLNNLNVLDLFAGSGALGIEALSRGANSVVFVDNAYSSLSVIKDNLRKLGIVEKAKVIKSDSVIYVNNTELQFDIVFCDPPYGYTKFEEILGTNKLHLAVLESGSDIRKQINEKNYRLIQFKRYGDSFVTIVEHKFS